MVVREFAENVLSNMPANAIILTKGDLPSNSLRWKRYKENYHIRPNKRPGRLRKFVLYY